MAQFAEIVAGVVSNVAEASVVSDLPSGVWVPIAGVPPAPQIGWAAAETAGVWGFTAPPPIAPTLAASAAAAILGGITLTLSGSVTLAATVFPTDPATQVKVGAVVNGLTALGTFPGGAPTFPMKDRTGAWHAFTPAQYKAVAGAILSYVAPLQLIADGNPLGSAALPPASVALTV